MLRIINTSAELIKTRKTSGVKVCKWLCSIFTYFYVCCSKYISSCFNCKYFETSSLFYWLTSSWNSVLSWVARCNSCCHLRWNPLASWGVIITRPFISCPAIPSSVVRWWVYPIYIHIYGTHSSEGKRRQGKKDQRLRLNLAPTLYSGVSATRATETGRDPSSPITLMYQAQVCRYPVTLKTCASSLVLCAVWW